MKLKSLVSIKLTALHYERKEDFSLGECLGWSHSVHTVSVYEGETQEDAVYNFVDHLHNISNTFIHKFEIEYL